MIPIHERETQARYVERVLRAEGRISAFDAMYSLVDDAGRRRSITRLAAIIEPLRKAGWTIATEGGHGELATYRLTSLPVTQVASRSPWRCSQCGADARMEPTPLLGGMGEAYCPTCGKSRLFRRAA